MGVVEKTSGDGSIKQGQRVLINPGIGWDTDPLGPEEDYYILGLLPAIGMFICCSSMHTLFGNTQGIRHLCRGGGGRK